MPSFGSGQGHAGAPHDWDVVVLGAWNPAILTPGGVAKRLFELKDVAVQINVPVDGMAPIQILHDGLIVVPSSTSLIVSIQDPSVQAVTRAATVATRAIQSLPDTPMTAAGVNLRYRFQSAPDQFNAWLGSELDGELSDAGFEIRKLALQRELAWAGGTLNLHVSQLGAVADLLFNFHRASDKPDELVAWLSRASEMVEATLELLEKHLKLSLQEI